MQLFIRKGTTKTLTLAIDTCCGDTKTWSDLGTVRVRLVQGNITIDKTITVSAQDPTTATVSYTQEETNQLSVGSNFQLQLFAIKGPAATEVAAKSDIYEGKVLPSLWNEVIHNGQ